MRLSPNWRALQVTPQRFTLRDVEALSLVFFSVIGCPLLLFRFGEDDPLPAARFYQRANSIGHGVPPGFLDESCDEIISSSGKYVP